MTPNRVVAVCVPPERLDEAGEVPPDDLFLLAVLARPSRLEDLAQDIQVLVDDKGRVPLAIAQDFQIGDVKGGDRHRREDAIPVNVANMQA